MMSAKPTKVPTSSPVALDKQTLNAMTVLIVEDATHMASIVCGMLKSLGIGKILEARNGPDALDMLVMQDISTPGAQDIIEHKINLILVDDLAPPLDGLSVVRELRKSVKGKAASLPVIYITSKLEKSAIIEARDAGVTEILSKPFSTAQMIQRIVAVMTKPRPIVESAAFVGPDRRRRDKVADEKRRASDQPA